MSIKDYRVASEKEISSLLAFGEQSQERLARFESRIALLKLLVMNLLLAFIGLTLWVSFAAGAPARLQYVDWPFLAGLVGLLLVIASVLARIIHDLVGANVRVRRMEF